jgi:LmbE family N-acetylglucosaminyl deacetylase
MQKQGFEFVRLVGNERRVGTTLASVSRHWQSKKEHFLVVSPHDDDAVLGAGLLIQLAKRENVPVHVLIVTDGSMGYCSLEEKDAIIQTRCSESLQCYRSLGVPKENIVRLDFPDCRLNDYRGRRPAKPGDAPAICSFTGLQNSFTYHLRSVRPTQCFLPTWNDLHPDHRIVYEEFLISLFHAAGNIWPELGKPLASVPYVHAYAVYCDFAAPPTLRMRAPQSYLDNKLAAIESFRSQRQISALIENVRHYGPEEYIKALEFKLYHPALYRDMFEERGAISVLR